MEKLYIIKGREALNVKELLIQCFSGLEISGFVSTFYDEDCKTVQTAEGRSRSFGDIFAICKTYFPETTESEVAYTLLSLQPTTIMKAPRICWLYCLDIDKGVFWLGGENSKVDLHFSCLAYHKDFWESVGRDNYSFNYILALANDYFTNIIKTIV